MIRTIPHHSWLELKCLGSCTSKDYRIESKISGGTCAIKGSSALLDADGDMPYTLPMAIAGMDLSAAAPRHGDMLEVFTTGKEHSIPIR